MRTGILCYGDTLQDSTSHVMEEVAQSETALITAEMREVSVVKNEQSH